MYAYRLKNEYAPRILYLLIYKIYKTYIEIFFDALNIKKKYIHIRMNILEYSRDKKYLDRIKKLIGKFNGIF